MACSKAERPATTEPVGGPGKPSPAKLATREALQRSVATCIVAVGLADAPRQLEEWPMLRPSVGGAA